MSAAGTPLGCLIESLRSRDQKLDGQTRSAAILWTDPESEWKSLLPLLKTDLPELLVLGEFDPKARTGPAVWIRCLVERALEEPDLPEERVPIVYLPGLARQDLRAGEEMNPAWKPLVELMYRGGMWLQANGGDWTVRAFLTSKKSLGLNIAGDQGTAQALLRALPEFFRQPLSSLKNRRMEADYFDGLLVPDPRRDLLRWMSDPDGTRTALGEVRWKALCKSVEKDFDFDPEKDADVVAGELLGLKQGIWLTVWERFLDAPESYPGIPGLLERSQPDQMGLFDREPWPKLNQQDEEDARESLLQVPGLGHQEACKTILSLEREHGRRRDWVWARLGRCPMAQILEPLARLAKGVQQSLGGATPESFRNVYLERGWQTDLAAWEAVARARVEEDFLVQDLVRHLMSPWIDESARAFQAAVQTVSLPAADEQETVTAPEGGVLLFCDGLRFDLSQVLAERLEGRGFRVEIHPRWAPLPTVTATGKPAVTPVAGDLAGLELDEDFSPAFRDSRKTVSAPRLREALEEAGFQVLGEGEMNLPASPTSRGWAEERDIDGLGHKLKGRLARHLREEVDALAEKVRLLLENGWRSVRIVTDHGWLWLPGGLPKVELPKFLTECRWARCGVLSGESSTEMPRYAWGWNQACTFVTAPGAACFKSGEEYAHGGVSIQECLIPDILVSGGTNTPTFTASIKSIAWSRMSCKVKAEVKGVVQADLRLESPSGRSVTYGAKTFKDGSVRLLVDDAFEKHPLVLVLLDEAGQILTHRPTQVGKDS